MDKILINIIAWLNALATSPRQPDPLDDLSLLELADLPAVHPQADL